MNRSIITFAILLVSLDLLATGYDPTVTVEIPLSKAAQLHQNGGLGFNGQGPGCLNTMVNQVNQGMTSKFQQQQQEANSLMAISQKYFELGKSCRNDLGQSLIDFENAKLELSKEQNSLNASMRDQEIAYKKALLQVKRECDETANQQFAAYKGQVGTGLVDAPQALFGRTERTNKFRKIFYDDCLADPLNMEAMRIAGLELASNIEKIQTNLKNATDSMASITKQLEFAQDQTLRNCAEGKEQLAYQEQMIRYTNAQSQALIQKQNLFGLLGSGMTCLFGPNSVVPGYANDGTNGQRMPTAASGTSL